MMGVWTAHEKWITCFYVRYLAHCLLCGKRLEVLPSLEQQEMSSGLCRYKALAGCRETQQDHTTQIQIQTT